MSRLARQRRRRSGAGRPIFIVLGALFATLLLAVGAGAVYIVHWVDKAPPLSQLHPVVGGGNSQIFAADGTPLGYIESDVLRSPVGGDVIPQDLKNATVAIEDQRFYQHGGVDIEGIARSAVKDLLSGAPIQGGSTIAMQLVRNLYMPANERTDRTLKRKIIEAVEADRLEKVHSKQWILTRYLNSVPYGTVGGQNAIGVQAAARVFFNKTVSQLDLEQSALLAGLPQAPSEYNPFLDPTAATTRRNQVLAKMAQLHYITQAQASVAEASPLEVEHSSYYDRHRESYFFDYVTQQLIDTYGLNTVREGGLRVYTTINLRMEDLAQKALDNDLNEPGDPAAAIVTEDPRTGYILAMAQTRSSSQYNFVSQGHRQPGSTFKAIVLADALSQGVDPDTTYYLSHTLEPGWLPSNPTYPVQTFEGVSLNRSINLVQATLASDNTVYAQLAADLGEKSVTQMAYRLGVRTHLNSYPAEALGGLTIGVSPLEMANVYATLADGGYRNRQISITHVVFPGGRVDSHWGVPSRVQVLSDGITAEETKILEENVQSGTATRSAIGCPTAAKTGTTSQLIDAWLDGYTPHYSTIVWMGYPNKRVSMTDVHGEPQQGGFLPAQIWHDYMAPVVGNNCVSFPPPAAPITYQPFSGHYQEMDSRSYYQTVSPYTGGAPPTVTTTPTPHHHHAATGGVSPTDQVPGTAVNPSPTPTPTQTPSTGGGTPPAGGQAAPGGTAPTPNQPTPGTGSPPGGTATP